MIGSHEVPHAVNQAFGFTSGADMDQLGTRDFRCLAVASGQGQVPFGYGLNFVSHESTVCADRSKHERLRFGRSVARCKGNEFEWLYRTLALHGLEPFDGDAAAFFVVLHDACGMKVSVPSDDGRTDFGARRFCCLPGHRIEQRGVELACLGLPFESQSNVGLGG